MGEGLILGTSSTSPPPSKIGAPSPLGIVWSESVANPEEGVVTMSSSPC